MNDALGLTYHPALNCAHIGEHAVAALEARGTGKAWPRHERGLRAACRHAWDMIRIDGACCRTCM